jgi:hypothetical protein
MDYRYSGSILLRPNLKGTAKNMLLVQFSDFYSIRSRKILPSFATTILKFYIGLNFYARRFNTSDIAYGPYQSPGILPSLAPSYAI